MRLLSMLLFFVNMINAQILSKNDKICGSLFPKVIGGPKGDTNVYQLSYDNNNNRIAMVGRSYDETLFTSFVGTNLNQPYLAVFGPSLVSNTVP
jgi:hypothetical protein